MIFTTIFGLVLFAGGYLLKTFFAIDAAEKFFSKTLMLGGVVLVVLPFFFACSLKSSQIAHAGFQVGDGASTKYAESRGAVEANPFMQTGWPTRIALKSAVTVGVIVASNQMQKMGHPRIAKGFVMTLNAVLAGVVVNNLSVAWGQR